MIRLWRNASAALAFVACSGPAAPMAQDTADTTAEVLVVTPPTCPGEDWIPWLLDDGGVRKPLCIADYPTWPLTDPAIAAWQTDGALASDPRTSLQWAIGAQPSGSWQEAADACDGLVLAGRADWRLPAPTELDTTLDFSRYAPASATVFTHGPTAGYLWSARRLGARAWAVDAVSGARVRLDIRQAASARCVRGGSSSLSATQRLAAVATDIVVDRATGLEWFADPLSHRYQTIQAYGWCSHLNALGHGWRPPTLPELLGLVSTAGGAPVVPSALFPDARDAYWTSSFFAGSAGGAWTVDLMTGESQPLAMTYTANILCVRMACGDGVCAPAEGPDACPADCPSGVTLTAGSTWVGCNPVLDAACEASEWPQHLVTLPAFVIDAHEVSVSEFEACVRAGVCTGPEDGAPGGTFPHSRDRPVNLVTWQEARTFCRAYRGSGSDLPTEAEWERAARGICPAGADEACAATMPPWPWGADVADCDHACMLPTAATVTAWTTCGSKVPCGCGGQRPSAVAQTPQDRSGEGVLDLAGNVAEWTRTADGPYPATADLESGAAVPSAVIVRGGSFLTGVPGTRASHRRAEPPDSRDAGIGFRCVRHLPP